MDNINKKIMDDKNNPSDNEYRMLLKINELFGYEYVPFGNKYSPIDGIMFSRNEKGTYPVALYEIKSRLDEKFNVKKLEEVGVLVTKNKINNGKDLSKLFGIPFVIFYYFPHEDTCYSFRTFDKYGNLLIEYEEKQFKTQKSMKGGSIVRDNVVIQLSQGKKMW